MALAKRFDDVEVHPSWWPVPYVWSAADTERKAIERDVRLGGAAVLLLGQLRVDLLLRDEQLVQLR
ncbi:hypothetical protein E1181_02600 [Saccharopolyspora terrae]|uniref:Uncharacterized protein n=1 Tax=Saccharopolyspora terrae TaxID=2530384 RepID=A0A4R4VVT9_9PSEU|nr:hypothetical protein E1181_02600 [Saccharopolyspora terrae]